MASISVIVPSYNHAPFLPQRLDSILGQTRGDFELLILDDCSPDDSRAVIERYKARDPRIRTHFNDANSGNTYFQWAKGLELTTGDYVWIAESDDFAEPTFLERLSAELDAHPDAGLAFCETMVVDDAGSPIAPYFARWRRFNGSYGDLTLLQHAFVMDGRDFLRSYMIPWNTIPNASAVLFRRSALAAAGGPATTMRLCGDWLTYCRILARFAVAHLPDLLNYFREHPTNVRSSIKAELLLAESGEVIRWAERELGPLPRRARAEHTDFVANTLVNMARAGPRNRVPIARLPATLARAGRHSPSLVASATRILARDLLGRVAALVRHR